ncbi:heat-inducible transcriptional repressor HrcA [Nitrospinaceae bacterium]|nr:heat-inducible transcriptional repressor HrcA [Nitrospinaceae bacterium]
MNSPVLDERSKSVLFAIIDKYIESAEPVGSRTVARIHPEHLSSATIRNAMSDLEDNGFLSQPHTSAGRIPTDKGYRFYVDHLLRPQNFLMEAENLSTAQNLDYTSGKTNLQSVLENACNSLSTVSQQTGLVMLPSFSTTCFKHIEFTKVAPQAALAVFFSEQGILQNKILPVESNMTQDQLTSISNYLNDEFSGKPIKWIRKELLNRLRLEKQHYNQLARKAHDLSSTLFEDTNNELLVQGALNLLDQPEFNEDIGKIKSLLKTLEEKTKLVNLLDLCLNHEGMTILIGEESLQEEMGNCSLIAQNYQLGTEKVGTLAVFGSKRMDYKKIISIVNHTAQRVSKLISENQGV